MVVTGVWREEVHLFAEMNSKDMYFRNIGAVTMADIPQYIAAFYYYFLVRLIRGLVPNFRYDNGNAVDVRRLFRFILLKNLLPVLLSVVGSEPMTGPQLHFCRSAAAAFAIAFRYFG